jgi:hypothetical protein
MVTTPLRPQPRNRGQLHGDIEASGHTPVTVLDGLDEAVYRANQIATEIIIFLAEVATVVVATRRIITTDGVTDCARVVGRGLCRFRSIRTGSPTCHRK